MVRIILQGPYNVIRCERAVFCISYGFYIVVGIGMDNAVPIIMTVHICPAPYGLVFQRPSCIIAEIGDGMASGWRQRNPLDVQVDIGLHIGNDIAGIGQIFQRGGGQHGITESIRILNAHGVLILEMIYKLFRDNLVAASAKPGRPAGKTGVPQVFEKKRANVADILSAAFVHQIKGAAFMRAVV